MSVGAMSDNDPGDEDDIEACPQRMWPRFTVGRPMCYQPLSWTHERLPALPEHDPGDEHWFTWYQRNSDVTMQRVRKRLFG